MSSIENLIMMNLNLIKGDNDMAIFYTMNNEYCIELSRTSVRLWNEGTNFKYFCKFIFKNNLGIPIFELTTTEIDIDTFLDTIYNVYIDFNAPECIYYFNNSSSILETFSFAFIREKEITNDAYNTTIVVSQYNNITKQKIDRVRLSLTDQQLADFFDEMYFIFLIDIDNSLIQYDSPHE